jgi:adenylyltransferase/sulfurtransferase
LVLYAEQLRKGGIHLKPQDLDRWNRQIAIPQFGIEGQEKLQNSKVVIFGVGGVGCATALYLAVAGVRNLVLVDHDIVALSNLNRQILYRLSDMNQAKASIAAKQLSAIDPSIKIEVIDKFADFKTIEEIVEGCTFVVDAFDRIKDRLNINKVCFEKNLVAAHGFGQEFVGEVIVLSPGETACLNCVLDKDATEPAVTPIMGVTAGIVGIGLANEAIKYITGYGIVKTGCRMFWDLGFDQYLTFPIQQRANCEICGNPESGKGSF